MKVRSCQGSGFTTRFLFFWPCQDAELGAVAGLLMGLESIRRGDRFAAADIAEARGEVTTEQSDFLDRLGAYRATLRLTRLLSFNRSGEHDASSF